MLLVLSQVSLFGVLLRITGWLIGSAELWGILLAVSSVGAMVVGGAVAWRQNDIQGFARIGIRYAQRVSSARGDHRWGLREELGHGIPAGFRDRRPSGLLGGCFSPRAFRARSRLEPPGSGIDARRLCHVSRGLPPTVGFMGRFQLFDLAVGDGRNGLVAVALVSTAVGFYLYSRIPVALFMESHDSDSSTNTVGLGWNVVWTGCLLTVVTFGIFPESWLALAGRAALEFF